MTRKNLEKKIQECINSDKKLIAKKITSLLDSGAVNIEEAEDNYRLPKNILCALYKEMSRQYSPMDGDREQKKIVNNLYTFI